MNLRFLAFFGASIILGASLLRADDVQTIKVTVTDGDEVTIQIPAAWQSKINQPSEKSLLAVNVASPDDSVLLQISFYAVGEGKFTEKEDVNRAATKLNQRYVKNSVEKRIDLVQIGSKDSHGCYAKFTDTDLMHVLVLAKGQYRNVLSGIVVIKKQAAMFKLLTNDQKSADTAQAMQIVTEGISAP